MLPSIFRPTRNEFPRTFEDLIDDFIGFDPYKGAIDRLYEKYGSGLLATDMKETDEGFEIDVNIPGFTKDEINLSLEDGSLIVSVAKTVNKDEDKKDNYIHHERYMGSASRTFYLGKGLTEEDIKAKFEHGVLSLFVPKKKAEEVEKVHRIAIEG